MKEGALLEAVLAAPDDDAPRLVYADFLQERGDPQGELIVVQCERERLEREEKTTTLEYRQASWRERALLVNFSGDYRRGFKRRYAMSAPTQARLEALSNDPMAPLLETLVFRRDDEILLDAQHALALAPSLPKDEPLWPMEHGLPHPSLLRAVDGVRYGVTTERKIRDLMELDPPMLNSVACLNGLRFTAGALVAYARTRSFARLEHLELWRVQEIEAYDFMTAAPREAKHLTIVTEEEPRTPYWTSVPFRNCPALPHVRELHLSVPYEVADIRALDYVAGDLERWIAPDGLNEVAREVLSKSSVPSRLRSLEMAFEGTPDIADLITAPWERLTSLALGNARIGLELAKAPALETLVSLRLFGCKIAGDVEAAIRARWPHVRIE